MSLFLAEDLMLPLLAPPTQQFRKLCNDTEL